MINARFMKREETFKRLKALVPDIEKKVDPAVEKGTDEVAALAARLAPRRTGEYARSIKVRKVTSRTGGRFGGVQTVVKSAAYGVYASYVWRFVEFGTAARDGHPGTSARPHLFPAYRALRRRVRSRISRVINKAVKDA